MKIVLIGPVYPYRGGIAHHISTLYQYLINSGHSVKVISFKRQYPKWLYPGKTDRDKSTIIIDTEADYLIDALNPFSWINTAKQIISFAPDCTLIQWWTTFGAIPFYLICKYIQTKNIPIYFIIHNVILHEVSPWDYFLAKLTLSISNGFVVQSINQLSTLKFLLKPEVNIQFCPHPIYCQFKCDSLSKTEAKQLLGIKDDRIILLFFGIIRKYKGLNNLINALNILIKERFNVSLIIAGEFWEEKQKFESIIKKLNLRNDVFIIDKYIPNEEVSRYFIAADIFIAPYIGGTQNGTVKVGINFGLPLVITPHLMDDLIIKYQIQNQVVIIPPKNEIEIANAIKTIINDFPKTTKQNNFFQESWENLVNTIEKLHDSFK